MFTRIRRTRPHFGVGNAIAESSWPQSSGSEEIMANRKSETGAVSSTVGGSARVVHAFVRDQVLTMLAPVYLLRHRRASRDVGPDASCTSRATIELHPTGIGRS
jgi:hypothetical protein